MPACAVYGQQTAFVCPTCGSPLDGQLGIDCVAQSHALEMLNCAKTRTLWRRITQYEQFQIGALQIKQTDAKRRKKADIILSLANLLLRGRAGSQFRPIDCFDNRFCNAPKKMGWANRHLTEPFAAAQLVERRKAMTIIIATLEDRFEQFGFDPHYAYAHHCRDAMSASDFCIFERHLFDLARLALPF